jgi:mannose-6-phosphate isomerase-like protein (cupin superfamily)
MNFDFLKDQNYLNALENKDYFHFGKVNVPIPSWEEILYEFDREYQIHKFNKDDKIFQYKNNLAFILLDCSKINIVNRFVQELTNNQKDDQLIWTIFGFVNLSKLSETYGRHNDHMDVWFWQLKGCTQFKVEGRNRDFEKIIEPGELLYIPKGMWHDTRPMGPRVAISMALEISFKEKQGLHNEN